MDITFSKDAKDPETCVNSTGVGSAPFAFGGVDLVPASSVDGGDDKDGEDKAADGDDKKSAAVGVKVSSGFAALTMVVVAGMMM